MDRTEDLGTKIVMVCVLQVPMTTATKEAKLQPKRNVAQPERSVVELVPQHACCSGPAPAQRRRSTTRHCIKDWMTNKSKKRTQNYRIISHKTRHCIKDLMTNKGITCTQNHRKTPHKGKRTLKNVRQYHTKDEQQGRQRLTASALRTSAKVGKREELCHTLHKDGRRTLTQACSHERLVRTTVYQCCT